MKIEQLKNEYYENLNILKSFKKGWDEDKGKPYTKYMIEMIENFLLELEKQNLLQYFEEIRPFPVHDNEMQVVALLDSKYRDNFQFEFNFTFYDEMIECYDKFCSHHEDTEEVNYILIPMFFPVKYIIELIKLNLIDGRVKN